MIGFQSGRMDSDLSARRGLGIFDHPWLYYGVFAGCFILKRMTQAIT